MIEVGDLLSKNIYISLFIVSFLTAIVTFLITGNLKESEFDKKNVLQIEKCANPQDVSENKDGSIVVDLSGAVNKPGIYELATTSRVADLLKLGGGIDTSASELWVSKHLNLASKLSDSQKIYIPFEWDIDTGSTELSADLSMTYDAAVSYISSESSSAVDKDTKLADDAKGVLNVNKATATELDTLPGIGSVYAAKIVSNRPYKNAQDLSQKAGIPISTVEKFESLISF